MSSARYLRQVLLPEIGLEGQKRIEGARARVGGDGLAHAIAERYALGAGFAGVDPGELDLAELAPEVIVRSTAAREVLAGARAALRALRAAVGS